MFTLHIFLPAVQPPPVGARNVQIEMNNHSIWFGFLSVPLTNHSGLPTNKKTIKCIRLEETVNIRNLHKTHKNGFDLLSAPPR